MLAPGARDATPAPGSASSWVRRIASRSVTLYALVYMLPFPLGFPGTERVAALVTSAKAWPIVTLGRALGVELSTVQSGSSDGLLAWWSAGSYGLLALAAGTLIVALTRRSPHDERWRRIGRTALRYFVGATMLVYGAVKVFKSQFPALEPSDLQVTYGDSTPMGLLWRMMGSSTGYTVLTGAVEVTGALLLFFRRTTLLGVVLLSIALVQVVALNLAFDVPVKLGSMHLLAFTLVLGAPHARRTIAFLLGAPTQAFRESGLAEELPRARRALQVLKTVVVVGTVGIVSFESFAAWRTWGDGKPDAPLVALYDVTDMRVDRAEGPAATVDGADACAGRWHRVTMDRNGFVAFGARGGLQGFAFEYDAEARALVVVSSAGRLASEPGSTSADAETIRLEGTLGGRPAIVELRRVPAASIPLTSHETRWVTERSSWR